MTEKTDVTARELAAVRAQLARASIDSSLNVMDRIGELERAVDALIGIVARLRS